MADDVVRISCGISVNYIAGSEREDVYEVPRAEWEAMSKEEREQYLEGLAQEQIDNSVNAWAYLEDED